MQGPYSHGSLAGLLAPLKGVRERLERGQAYQVIKPFQDADTHDHPVAEMWIFLGEMFNKFDDELIFCVRFADSAEWKIPLSCRTEKQEDVLGRWKDYLAPAQMARGRTTDYINQIGTQSVQVIARTPTGIGAIQQLGGSDTVIANAWYIDYDTEDELAKILQRLRDADVAFAGGPSGWPPAAMAEWLREKGKFHGVFKEVCWREPGQEVVRQR